MARLADVAGKAEGAVNEPCRLADMESPLGIDEVALKIDYDERFANRKFRNGGWVDWKHGCPVVSKSLT
jgi:hypothetical protein